jgi:hypothetical protein
MPAFKLAAAAAALVAFTLTAEAAVTTPFQSQAGSAIVGLGGTPVSQGAVVISKPHPAWVPHGTAFGNGDARWIADTAASSPKNSKPVPYMVVEETFSLAAWQKGTVSFEAYADDTARVLLNGIELMPANFSQGTCAAGKIGCEPGEGGLFSDLALVAGLNTLRFEVFQVGGGPFGLQYAGATTVTPIPAAAALLGTALAGLGWAARRRARAG